MSRAPSPFYFFSPPSGAKHLRAITPVGDVRDVCRTLAGLHGLPRPV